MSWYGKEHEAFPGPSGSSGAIICGQPGGVAAIRASFGKKFAAGAGLLAALDIGCALPGDSPQQRLGKVIAQGFIYLPPEIAKRGILSQYGYEPLSIGVGTCWRSGSAYYFRLLFAPMQGQRQQS